MKIHKEGYRIILFNTLLSIALSVLSYHYLPPWASIPLIIWFVLYACFHIRFFRIPKRERHPEDNSHIFSPADGEIVTIEEVFETEYINEPRMQVSIFMSIWNVHVNWFPVGGNVEYFRHHNGTFKVAWHPKSSTENERTTTIINTGTRLILFRQIAGFVARRIVNHASKATKQQYQQGEECGVIKYGSRIDIMLPMDAVINVELGQKVVGTQTIIATMPKTTIE